MKLELTLDSGKVSFSAKTLGDNKPQLNALCGEFIFYLLGHNAVSKEQIFSCVAQYELIEAAKHSDERRNEEHN